MTKKEYNLALENQELKGKLKSYETNILPMQSQQLLIVVSIVIILKILTYNYIYKRSFKNAINFSQLIEDINVSLKELQYTSEHGYIQGVSNIMIKAVKDM